jgi:hypothetical protein
MRLRTLLAPLAVLAAAAAVRAADAWHVGLDKAIEAARRSGRPVLAVTIWKAGVCASCDAWRERVRPDPEFTRQLQRFEPAEWTYDCLGGEVIRWTLANGGRSPDPSAQLFVVGWDRKAVARLDDAKVTTPAAVAAWMKEQADAWERDHPRTAVPFRRASVELVGDGADRAPRCAELDAARAAGSVVLLYVTRDADGGDKALRAEVAASRKLERALLDSKQVADAAAGAVLLRLDLAEDADRALAAALSADRAPALLLWEPAAEKPSKLPATLTAPDLAFRLRKALPPKDEKPK